MDSPPAGDIVTVAMAEFAHTKSPEGDATLFSLTQIRHLMRVEFGRAQRYGYSLSCVVVSVDRLGHLRDLYGYDAKEAILDDLTALLRRETRGCDYLGRLLDDRLMTVLPHTPPDGARVLAERLLRAARELSFDVDDRPLTITVSIGASHYENDNTMFFDAMLQAAEAALADASSEGGDRYVHRDPIGLGG